jgi:uncharacterized repeat protein (TIGR03806 family)
LKTVDLKTLRFILRLAAIFQYAAFGCSFPLLAKEDRRPYGLESRPTAKPYLDMAESETGAFPKRLSETGAFKSTRDLVPVDSLIPYDLAVAFYSDGASKSRWISVPNDSSHPGSKIAFAAADEWKFPNGTVFVKHFEFRIDETRPGLTRRLETRLLVRESGGSVYGATYKWRADNSDADLLATNLSEEILIRTAAGVRTQTWYYPSRQDCRTCHTDLAGGVLGVKTRQLNRGLLYGNGVQDNELRAWNHIGLFEPQLDEAALPAYPRLARAADATRSVEERARSYLDANCAHCHRPGGTIGNFDARYDTPLGRQNLIGGSVLIDQGIDRPQIIAPNDIWRSIAFMRINTLEGYKMPPLAHETFDEQGKGILRAWIQSLPGPPVLAPPELPPPPNHDVDFLEVALSHNEPGAAIHYTLDGSAPTVSDPVYEKPIKLENSTVVRAKAFKRGFTKSITVQQIYILGR